MKVSEDSNITNISILNVICFRSCDYTYICFLNHSLYPLLDLIKYKVEVMFRCIDLLIYSKGICYASGLRLALTLCSKIFRVLGGDVYKRFIKIHCLDYYLYCLKISLINIDSWDWFRGSITWFLHLHWSVSAWLTLNCK